MLPNISPDSPSWVQHPDLIKAISKLQWIRKCPCGLMSYRHDNKWTTPIHCTAVNCTKHVILKDESIYHCLNRHCFQRICAQCHQQTSVLRDEDKAELTTTFLTILHDGFGQLPDFLTPQSFHNCSHLPQLARPPDDLWHTIAPAEEEPIVLVKISLPKELAPDFSSPDSLLFYPVPRSPWAPAQGCVHSTS